MHAEPTKQPRRVKTKATGVYRSISGKYEIAYRDSDGRLRFKTVDGDLEAAKAARAEVVSKLHRGERVAPTKATFGEWSQEWLAGLNKRPNTVEGHGYALKHLARFDRKKLGEISTDNVARLVADMSKAGYSGWTITRTLSTLSSCLGRAKRRGLIATNPVRELTRDERPRVDNSPKRVLSETEIADALGHATNQFRPLIATLIFAGLRLGEALALRWESIDYEEGVIRVRYQLTRGRELAPLKTSSGARDVALIPHLAKTLKEHYMASLHKQPSDFLFPAPDGRGRDQRSTARAVERTFERAGIGDQGLSSHSMRHTYASLLIVGAKLDPVAVAAQLGHSNPSTTLRCYAHLFDKARHTAEVRDKLEAGFGQLLAAKATV